MGAPVLISRAEAIKNGLKYYYPGFACPKGHESKRHIGGSCYECLKDRSRARSRKIGKELREKNAEYWKQWRAANKGRQKKLRRRHYEQNRDKYFDSASDRRARLKNSTGKHTAAQIRAMYKAQEGLCANPQCRCSLENGYHKDHIQPLILEGSNDISNIQLLCPPCNLRKGARIAA